jgi:prefoldin beta subunit
MKIKKETREKIQEIQVLEQNLQALMMQVQAFKSEIEETDNALSEISNTKGDVFKIVGNIMIKTEKEPIAKELGEKKNILSLRLKTLEKQENSVHERVDKLKEEVTEEIKKEQ